MPGHYEVYHPTRWTPPDGSWASSDAIRRTMVRCRSRDTSPELILRSILHRRGRRFRVAFRPVPSVRRSADVVFPRARLAVFMDGCFWHGCPVHFVLPATNRSYWEGKISSNAKRDGDTDQRLREAGWTVLRLWEHEQPDVAADAVESALREATVALGASSVLRGSLGTA
jgi:DNA mismatch endonuclease (patch repair protein)